MRVRLGRYRVKLYLVWDCTGNAASLIGCSEVAQETAGSKCVPPKQFHDAIWHNLDPDLSELVWDNGWLDLRWARIWHCPRRFCTGKWHHHQLAEWEREQARGRSNINLLRNLCWYFQLLLRDCGNAFKVSGRNGSPMFTTYSKMLANLVILLSSW